MNICLQCQRECDVITDLLPWGDDEETMELELVSDCCFEHYRSYDDDYVESFKVLVELEDYNEDELTEDDQLLLGLFTDEV